MITEEMVHAAAMVLNKHLSDGNGLHGVSRDMITAAFAAMPGTAVKVQSGDTDVTLFAAAMKLLTRWDAFQESPANMEHAYYQLAKYAYGDWEFLRAAITKEPIR